MLWDLGLQGLTVLVGMSLTFGLFAQLLLGRGIGWLWAVGTGVFFVSGLLISEAWFGWATQEDLQPNIDGLSFDETLLAAVPGLAAVWLTRYLVRRTLTPRHETVSAAVRHRAG